MRAEITDVNALRALRPLDIASYLHATGWQNTENLGDRASLWVKNDMPDAEVVLPRRQSFADFALRVSDLLDVLSKQERRSQLQVYVDVASVSSDLVRLRAADRDTEQGSLSLTSGVDFIEGAHDVLLAAACSTVVRRGNFPRRKPKEANEYLKRVRLGQTERGSFVLNLLCPVTPQLRAQEPTTFFPEDPFERRVTHTLMSSVAAVRDASQQAAFTGNFAAFHEAIGLGVSANLCAAILKLGWVTSESGLEISMAWSKTRKIPANVPTLVKIEPDAFPIIEEAARIFRETEPQDDFHLVGFIEQLHRPEAARTGRAVITGLVDEQVRKVTVELPEPQYSVAVDAHDKRRTISCSGELVKEGRSYTLLNANDLRVLGDDENV